MPTPTRPVTAEALLRMPDDGFRYELVKGELGKMPHAGNEHGYRAMKFAWRLAQHIETTASGVSTPPKPVSKSTPTPTPCAPRTRPS
jgi:hypothetical protein